MKTIKRSSVVMPKDPLCGDSGVQKVCESSKQLRSIYFEAMTYGYLYAGEDF